MVGLQWYWAGTHDTPATSPFLWLLEEDCDDVQELLDYHDQELTIDALTEMHEQDIQELESLDSSIRRWNDDWDLTGLSLFEKASQILENRFHQRRAYYFQQSKGYKKNIKVVSPSIVLFGEFRRANSYCHLYGVQGLANTTGVLLVHCHDEFRGPRSDYVRLVTLATTTTDFKKPSISE
ncbi:hypothetical protein TNCV_3995741 [Trichonephila clavipes]|nr:hypothetical protein TNCV_3995741 [Trichonephila clavipes]